MRNITYVKLPDVINNLDWLKEYFHLTNQDLEVKEKDTDCGKCKVYHRDISIYRIFSKIVRNLPTDEYKLFCEKFQKLLKIGRDDNIFEFVFIDI